MTGVRSADKDFVQQLAEYAEKCPIFSPEELQVLQGYGPETILKIRDSKVTDWFPEKRAEVKESDDVQESKDDNLPSVRIRKFLNKESFAILKLKLQCEHLEWISPITKDDIVDYRIKTQRDMFDLQTDLNQGQTGKIANLSRVTNNWPSFIDRKKYLSFLTIFERIVTDCVVIDDTNKGQIIDEKSKKSMASFIQIVISQGLKDLCDDKGEIKSELLTALHIPSIGLIPKETLRLKLIADYLTNQVFSHLTRDIAIKYKKHFDYIDITDRSATLQRYLTTWTHPPAALLKLNLKFIFALNKLSDAIETRRESFGNKDSLFLALQNVYEQAQELQNNFLTNPDKVPSENEVDQLINTINSLVDRRKIPEVQEEKTPPVQQLFKMAAKHAENLLEHKEEQKENSAPSSSFKKIALVDIDGCSDQFGKLNQELVERLKAESYDVVILFSQRSKFMCKERCKISYKSDGQYQHNKAPFKLTREVVSELSAALHGKPIAVSTSVDHLFGDPMMYYEKANMGDFEARYTSEYARFQGALEEESKENVFDAKLEAELTEEQLTVRGEAQSENPNVYYPKKKVTQYKSLIPDLKKKYPNGFTITYFEDTDSHLEEVLQEHQDNQDGQYDFSLKCVLVDSGNKFTEANESVVEIDSYKVLIDYFEWLALSYKSLGFKKRTNVVPVEDAEVIKFIKQLKKFDVDAGKFYETIFNSLTEEAQQNKVLLDELFHAIKNIQNRFIQIRECQNDNELILPLVRPLLYKLAKFNQLLKPVVNQAENISELPAQKRRFQKTLSEKMGTLVTNPFVRWNLQRKLRVGELSDDEVPMFVGNERAGKARFLSKLHAKVANATSHYQLEQLKSAYDFAKKQNKEKTPEDNRSWFKKNWKPILGWTLFGMGIVAVGVCTAGIGVAVVGGGALTAATFTAGCGTVLATIGGGAATGVAAANIGIGVCVAGGAVISTALVVADQHYSQPTKKIVEPAPPLKLTFKEKIKSKMTPALLRLMGSGKEHKVEHPAHNNLTLPKSESFLKKIATTNEPADSTLSSSSPTSLSPKHL